MTSRALKHLCVDSGQYGLNIPAQEYRETGTRLIRTSDIAAGILSDANSGVFISKPAGDRFILRRNDVLLSRSGTIGRSFLVPDAAAGCSFAGFLIRYRPRSDVDGRYVAYVTQSADFQDQVKAEAVTSTIRNFNADRYANIRVPFALLAGQRRIADFLDDQVTRIDGVVAARHRQMELALASETATLDALFVERNPRPLKTYLARTPCYGVLVPRFVDQGGVPLIRVTDLSRPQLTQGVLAQIEASQSIEYRRTLVAEGDLLLGVVGSTDKALVVSAEMAGANVARAVARLVPAPGMSATVLHAWTRTSGYRNSAYLATSSDTAQPTLNMSDLKNFPVPIPENPGMALLRSQVHAVFTERETTLRSLRRSVALLYERKRALITACVTGEFDVSSASTRAPEAVIE